MTTNEYIENDKIRDLLKQKNEIVEEGRKLDAEMQKMQETQNKRVAKIQKLEEKAVKILQKLYEGKLPEFKELIGFDLKGDKIEVHIEDAVETFIAKYREVKAKQKNVKTDDSNTKQK